MAHRMVALALPGVVTFDLACAAQVFGPAAMPESPATPPYYDFAIASVRAGRVPTADCLALHAPLGLGALTDADTIVVPGYTSYEQPPALSVQRALRKAASRGARVMSICTGAFALAHAGLLDGRRATTHWAAAPALAERFPAVKVDPNVLYVDEGQFLTSAGVAAGLDLALHVVRSDVGAIAAAAIARWNVISPHRDGSQAQYAERSVSDEPGAGLADTRTWAMTRIGSPLTLKQLAAHARCSERTFTRRFRAETGSSPQQWLTQMRLQLAREMLETTDLSIERVANAAGFRSSAALRAQFADTLETTPSAYRRRFSLR